MAKLYISKEYQGNQTEIFERLKSKIPSLFSKYKPQIFYAKNYVSLLGKVDGTIGVTRIVTKQTIEIKLDVPFFSRKKIRKSLEEALKEVAK